MYFALKYRELLPAETMNSLVSAYMGKNKGKYISVEREIAGKPSKIKGLQSVSQTNRNLEVKSWKNVLCKRLMN